MDTLPYKIEIADQQSMPFAAEPLQQSIETILREHQIQFAEISLAVVDDPAIRRLNQQYLNHDYETDVISFVLDWDQTRQALVGQLIVSTDTAARLAVEFGVAMQDELLLYAIHGTLHLVGYDDKDPEAAAEMRRAEQKYLSRMNVPHRGFSTSPSSKLDSERRDG